MADEPLERARDEMRDLGYRVVDMLVEHFQSLPGQPPARTGSRAELERVLREPLPEHGQDPARALEQLTQHAFANMCHVDPPRFFAVAPSPGSFVSAAAGAVASGLT